MLRSEERLEVTTVRTATERVRIRRVIVTEERTITVRLRREELVVERKPLDGGIGDSPAVDPITMILHAEEPVVTTRVVPVERASVIVDRITATRTVSDSVRKERVDVHRCRSAPLDEDAEWAGLPLTWPHEDHHRADDLARGLLRCAGADRLRDRGSARRGCPTPTTSPETSTVATPLTGDIGTASFSGRDGTTGTFRFSANSGFLGIHSDDLATQTSGPISVVGALDPIAPDTECYDTGIRLGLGDIAPGVDFEGRWGLSTFDGDPTAIDQLVLTTSTFADPDCAADVLAIADIDWSIDPQRPDLIAVDSGPRAAAEGEVSLGDGRPSAYTVAPNDLVPDVAARFGMDSDDLLYLNPLRSGGSNDMLLVGEELNLTLAGR